MITLSGVPDSFRYIAVDQDGEVWAYRFHPDLDRQGGVWWGSEQVGGDQQMCLGMIADDNLSPFSKNSWAAGCWIRMQGTNDWYFVERPVDMIELYNDTNTVIDEIKNNNKEGLEGEPINWGDLGCINAERYEDMAGNKGFRVYVSEASEDAHKLKSLVCDMLGEYGYTNIEVITEW